VSDKFAEISEAMIIPSGWCTHENVSFFICCDSGGGGGGGGAAAVEVEEEKEEEEEADLGGGMDMFGAGEKEGGDY
jgi:hypothetical protein